MSLLQAVPRDLRYGLAFTEHARYWWGYVRGDGTMRLLNYLGRHELDAMQERGYTVRGPFVANSNSEAWAAFKRKAKEAREARAKRLAELCNSDGSDPSKTAA